MKNSAPVPAYIMRPMTLPAALDRGRDLFARHAWTDAYVQLSAADAESPLDPVDIERRSIAAYLNGKDAESIELLARAHHEWFHRGACERAARSAFWLFFIFRNKGQDARGSGWLARARRLLDEAQRDCVEQGYLLRPSPCRPQPKATWRLPTRPSSRRRRSASASARSISWRSPDRGGVGR
jgi:hypothetical protein